MAKEILSGWRGDSSVLFSFLPFPQQTGSFQVPLGGLGLTQQPPAWDQDRAGSGLSLEQEEQRFGAPGNTEQLLAEL